MTACDPATPIRERAPRPTWTISGGLPTPEGIRVLARLCLDAARRRLAARAEADGEEHEETDER
jgi:hypothetical protein